MSEELNNQNLPSDDKTKDDNLNIEDKIELTPQQYAALLEKSEELDDLKKSGKHKTYSLEELAEEGKGKKPDSTSTVRKPDKNLDDMNRLELAQYIVNVIGDHFAPIANDLQVQIQTIKVSQEIDRAASKYDDFWDLHEEILRIGTENPSLSIDKAYKLAKAERGEKPSKKSDKDQTLLTLPPKPILGEKPNAPSRSQTNAKVMTLTEAAEKAWGDLGEEAKK